MRKKTLLVGALLAFATLFTACDNWKKGTAKAVEKEVTEEVSVTEDPSVLKVDSVKFDVHWELSDPELAEYTGGEKPGLKCVIDVPSFKQNPVLANAIMEWINEHFGGTYKGDMKDVKSMVKAYIKFCRKEEGGMGSDAQYEFEIRKIYENENVVTYLMSGYDYAFGAAHGMPYINGASFRKSDGKLFGWNMFSNTADLQASLKRGLMDYFDVTEDSELEDNLMVDGIYSVNNLPKPDSDPWITKDGVEMVYQSYEVACFAAGQPNVVIPTAQAKTMLTATASKLLE